MNLPAHTQDIEAILSTLESDPRGLTPAQAAARLTRHGPNVLPKAAPVSVLRIFLRQFLDPLIYVLLFAAVVSMLIGKYTDALFIFGVLVINAIIGMAQEVSAQRSAASLDVLVTQVARVLRGGEAYELDAAQLVPGDIVMLESGDKVPADLRLINAQELRVDESLLSGESLPVVKNALAILPQDALVADRVNMAFAGTLVIHGRATGVTTATATATQLGLIARDVLGGGKAKPPLLIRMERFTWRLTWAMAAVTLAIALVVLYQGMGWVDVFLLAAALAVAAIPEGLPVAITIALAISVRRMAKRNVIARNLVAVEALGSCTFIATDKTGTLTRNEISVQCVRFPGEATLMLPASHLLDDESELADYRNGIPDSHIERLRELGLTCMLANEGFLGRREQGWARHGDSMDVALLVLAHNLGLSLAEQTRNYPPVAKIPFESANRYGASLHRIPGHPTDGGYRVFVKGAVETVLTMCDSRASTTGTLTLDRDAITGQAHELAEQGYRVLAAASGNIAATLAGEPNERDLRGLCFLGLLGMIDPLREESADAIKHCHAAGIKVAMLTGDHPTTAYAIARQLGLADSREQIVGSRELKQLDRDPVIRAQVLLDKRVYARLEPRQKLDVVSALQAGGHFVAMTGDGANDAPALRAAHVGVAMGRSGTAVARETADIILTDDNFASIVAGVEEGRIAYSNVRKVVHLLISTGAGEIVLFFLSLLAGLPIPLTAVQLLWLNLVTNGVQHVALAFEPGEGDELEKPPRKPNEAVLNRVMLERVVLAGIWIGTVAFVSFYFLLTNGYSEEQARAGTLLLMVLFENVHVFNSRSETRSVFRHNPLRNGLLLASVIAAQILHIGAMYTPGLSGILQITPVSFQYWLDFFMLSLTLLAVSEIYKAGRKLLNRGSRA